MGNCISETEQPKSGGNNIKENRQLENTVNQQAIGADTTDFDVLPDGNGLTQRLILNISCQNLPNLDK